MRPLLEPLRSAAVSVLPHDHFGEFSGALDGVNTPDTDNTLIFVVEDDAQDGPDHVDTQRTIAYVIGPYVRQGAVVSQHYGNPSMLRTIVDILNLEPMGLQVALADPMTEVFDRSQRDWTYTAVVPEVLRTTKLPLPPRVAANSLPMTDRLRRFATPRQTAEYWTKAMEGQDFNREDNLDTVKFNRVLWEGLMGTGLPYPTVRHGRDLSKNRDALPKAAGAAPVGGRR